MRRVRGRNGKIASREKETDEKVSISRQRHVILRRRARGPCPWRGQCCSAHDASDALLPAPSAFMHTGIRSCLHALAVFPVQGSRSAAPHAQVPPDPLLSISGRFKADPRAQKFDLGVGVLRKSDNTSHEFATVLEAGKAIGPNCYYPHPGGDDKFVELTGELIFGAKPPPRVCGVQTVGGSGALRVVAELLVSQGYAKSHRPHLSPLDAPFDVILCSHAPCL